MRLNDALFYWLQTKLMTEIRPDDEAARGSLRFFAQILSEDHGLASVEVDSSDAAKYRVSYRAKDGTAREVRFDREAAEQLAADLYGHASIEDGESEVNE
ncbi:MULTISPECIES: hypothetical protein [Cohnella]|uniref:hypothetical protein n=1 Tax=Cohnella TaxID=329857 RepID=UPI0009BB7D2F|nr:MULTISPECIES: hypothetical protein [Cohnella]MBN2983348.1 hypothetical protein [Cohnella algarum]